MLEDSTVSLSEKEKRDRRGQKIRLYILMVKLQVASENIFLH